MVGFSWIQTRIVGKEGKHADHLATTTTRETEYSSKGSGNLSKVSDLKIGGYALKRK